MPTLIITRPEYEKAAHIFDDADNFRCIPAPSPEPELAANIREHDARFIIVGVEEYTSELYDALPSGGVIARFGVGHDGIDKSRARQNGILCCNTPGTLDDSVAECAVGLMIDASRHIASCSASNKTGQWKPRIGSELAGKTLMIVGCGKIGCKVARMARDGFAMRVVGVDVQQPRHPDPFEDITDEFANAAPKADFVSLHIPDIPATQDFMDAKKLTTMKQSAILINTARGGVLDEDALYDALDSGDIAAAALDVFKNEPYTPQSSNKDLRNLDNIIMTPHIGSSTTEACERMARAALDNIRYAINGNEDKMDLVTHGS